MKFRAPLDEILLSSHDPNKYNYVFELRKFVFHNIHDSHQINVVVPLIHNFSTLFYYLKTF